MSELTVTSINLQEGDFAFFQASGADPQYVEEMLPLLFDIQKVASLTSRKWFCICCNFDVAVCRGLFDGDKDESNHRVLFPPLGPQDDLGSITRALDSEWAEVAAGEFEPTKCLRHHTVPQISKTAEFHDVRSTDAVKFLRKIVRPNPQALHLVYVDSGGHVDVDEVKSVLDRWPEADQTIVSNNNITVSIINLLHSNTYFFLKDYPERKPKRLDIGLRYWRKIGEATNAYHTP